MRRRAPPSLGSLKRTYSYDHETGHFRFLIPVGTRGLIGNIAGAKRVDGYIGVALDGKIYLAHHLAWYYHYGTWPPRLDHKNRVKSDNWIKNLRPASAPQNGVNNEGWSSRKRKYKFPKGVYLDPTKSKKPFAAIRVNAKLRILGFCDTVEEAEALYKTASLKYHGEFSLFNKEK